MTKLVIVTLLLAALALVLRRRTGSTARLHAIKVTGRTTMHRGVTIAVVEVDGRRLLVGAGAQSVNLIAELGGSGVSDAIDTSGVLDTAADVIAADLAATPLPVTAPSASAAPLALVPTTAPATLVDKLRHVTTRTADPAARHSAMRHRRPGATR